MRYNLKDYRKRGWNKRVHPRFFLKFSCLHRQYWQDMLCFVMAGGTGVLSAISKYFFKRFEYFEKIPYFCTNYFKTRQKSEKP